jgi:hypothetical protein
MSAWAHQDDSPALPPREREDDSPALPPREREDDAELLEREERARAEEETPCNS